MNGIDYEFRFHRVYVWHGEYIDPVPTWVMLRTMPITDEWWCRRWDGTWATCHPEIAARAVIHDVMTVRLGPPSLVERLWGEVVGLWRRKVWPGIEMSE